MITALRVVCAIVNSLPNTSHGVGFRFSPAAYLNLSLARAAPLASKPNVYCSLHFARSSSIARPADGKPDDQRINVDQDHCA
jgi:hypothetical protein